MTPERNQRLQELSKNRQNDIYIILENVRDFHNVGAVMRTCDAVGIPNIHMILDETYNPAKKKIGKHTSAGARKWVDAIEYTSIKKCISDIKMENCQVLGTTLSEDTVSIYDIDFTIPTVIVFGNEKKGLTDDAKNCIDQAISIPQKGLVQSLNISVACAVTLYELFRQRQLANMYNRDINHPLSTFFMEKYLAKDDERWQGEIRER